jgi:hypothetical protein
MLAESDVKAGAMQRAFPRPFPRSIRIVRSVMLQGGTNAAEGMDCP